MAITTPQLHNKATFLTPTNHTHTSAQSRLIAKDWTHPISNTNTNNTSTMQRKWGKPSVSNTLIKIPPKTHNKMDKTLFITSSLPWSWKRLSWKSPLTKLLAPAKNRTAFMIELSSSNKKNKEKSSVENSRLSKKRSVGFKIDPWSTHIPAPWWLNSATTQFTSDATRSSRNAKKKKRKTSEWSKNVKSKSMKPTNKSSKGTWAK